MRLLFLHFESVVKVQVFMFSGRLTAGNFVRFSSGSLISNVI